MASAVLILLYIQDELSYDRFHKDYDQIYRLGLHATNQGNEFRLALSSVPLAPTLLRDYPEVKSATRIFSLVGKPVIKYNGNSYLEERLYYADSGFFEVFSEGLLKGDPSQVLSRANTVVITDEMARKYFGDEDPIGKVVEIGVESMGSAYTLSEFEVTGIIEKYPGNSHLKFDFLGSLESLGFINSNYWMSYMVHTYIKLPEDYEPELLEAKLPEMVQKYVAPQWEPLIHNSMEESLKRGVIYRYFLQPIKDIHLGSDLEYDTEPGGKTGYLRVFSLIAAFLILIACINFVNLTTAQSATRAREVGIRKIAGSTRSKLVVQFLTESLLLSYLALIAGIILVGFLIPPFNSLAGKELSLDLIQNRILIPALLILGFLVGILSGIYPSFFLASYQPVRVLPGRIISGLKSRNLRGSLVSFQFSVAIILSISTIIAARQMNFIQNQGLGYEKEHLLVIKQAEFLLGQKGSFREEISKFPGVIESSFTTSLPSVPYSNSLFRPEGRGSEETHSINHWLVGFDLQNTLKLKMKEGRWISREFPGDTLGIVLNEKAARFMNLTDPLDKVLYVVGGIGDGDLPLRIIGIVKDFHYESIHNPIRPLAITFLPPQYSNYLLVRIGAENYQNTVSLINRTWRSFVKDHPFEYSFLEDDLLMAYQDDLRTGTIFRIFSVLAIFISCLGLIGMASYSAVRRTKEIGVRKVLGAAESEIISMLTREVYVYIGIATLIAWPAGYFFMKSWLQSFAFRVNLGFLPFLLASLVALVIALFTVGIRAYIAAVANPSESIRYE
jgi:putative ABC transport system permease protein